jgi:16S rRNA A1518/A1519 N6-dimethyltransferase RsmA/KsgA/DIM1 with predicted DNA glycosylase/AP lyase activity
MSPVKVVGNLPYSISTELVLRFLRDMDARRGVFSYGRAELYFVMQLEVVQVINREYAIWRILFVARA